MTNTSASTPTTTGSRSLARKVAITTMIGTATEWYDYFLYGIATALVFSTVFFPNYSAGVGTLASFGAFAVTFAVRPLGAVVFGHFGDKYGRKKTLVASIVMMGVGTVAIGLLPSYDVIGVWAPILLVALRILQGFAVGGEYGGATTMALEYAPANRRGLYASFPQMGNPLGLLLGTLMLYLFALLPDHQFTSWGWRIPFLLSAVLVGVGLYIRLTIVESPVFRRAQERQPTSRTPIVTLWRDYRRTMILTILAPAAINVSFYVFATWSIAYGRAELQLKSSTILIAVMIAAAVDALVQPLFGALSDRIGRRPVYIAGSIWIGLVAYPFFWLLNTGSALLIALAMMLAITIGHGATYSVQASFLAEQFGTTVRYSGLSIAFHVSSALLSGPGPFVAAGLFALTSSTAAISAIIVVASVVSVVAICTLRETSSVDINQWSASTAR
jgi:MFS transporter, MHS family, shikimate and dehydroshikimate transport protein